MASFAERCLTAPAAAGLARPDTITNLPRTVEALAEVDSELRWHVLADAAATAVLRGAVPRALVVQRRWLLGRARADELAAVETDGRRAAHAALARLGHARHVDHAAVDLELASLAGGRPRLLGGRDAQTLALVSTTLPDAAATFLAALAHLVQQDSVARLRFAGPELAWEEPIAAARLDHERLASLLTGGDGLAVTGTIAGEQPLRLELFPAFGGGFSLVVAPAALDLPLPLPLPGSRVQPLPCSQNELPGTPAELARDDRVPSPLRTREITDALRAAARGVLLDDLRAQLAGLGRPPLAELYSLSHWVPGPAALVILAYVSAQPEPRLPGEHKAWLHAHNNACFTAITHGTPEEKRAVLARALPFGADNVALFHNAACVYVRLGEPEAAVAAIHAAVRHGYPALPELIADADLTPLRGRADFVEAARAAERGEAEQRAALARDLLRGAEPPADLRALLRAQITWAHPLPAPLDRVLTSRPGDLPHADFLAHVDVVAEGHDERGRHLVGYYRGRDQQTPIGEAPVVCLSEHGELTVTGRSLTDHVARLIDLENRRTRGFAAHPQLFAALRAIVAAEPDLAPLGPLVDDPVELYLGPPASSRLGGAPYGFTAASRPRHGQAFMAHLATLAVADFPALADHEVLRAHPGALALAVFAADHAWAKSPRAYRAVSDERPWTGPPVDDAPRRRLDPGALLALFRPPP